MTSAKGPAPRTPRQKQPVVSARVLPDIKQAFHEQARRDKGKGGEQAVIEEFVTNYLTEKGRMKDGKIIPGR